ncbi:glycosyltransferase family 4 protein [Methanocaldococcus sp. 10A]
MEVIYTIGATLFGGGIGNTAYYEAEGLYRNDALKYVVAYDYKKHKIPNDKVKTLKFLKYIDMPLGFTRARFIPKLPQYEIMNNLFDYLASKYVKEGSDIFYGWMGMSLNQIRKAKKLGMKTVVVCASSHPTYQRKILEEEYKKWNVPFDLGNYKIYLKSLKEIEEADFIKIPSDFVEKTFIEHGVPKEKLIKIPFGVDLDKFKPKKNYKNDKFRAVFVGSVGIRKGVPYLLRAWDELNLKNAELYIVGAILNDIKHIIKKYKQREDIIFTGHTNPIPYLQKSDVFVFSSIEEGSALVTYEAMAVGLPSIVTFNTGSIVRDGKDGFVIPIRDVNALKEKILYFYENRDKIKRMGKNARKHVEKYSWERYGDRLFESLKEIL